jgi:hypothetical protein
VYRKQAAAAAIYLQINKARVQDSNLEDPFLQHPAGMSVSAITSMICAAGN